MKLKIVYPSTGITNAQHRLTLKRITEGACLLSVYVCIMFAEWIKYFLINLFQFRAFSNAYVIIKICYMILNIYQKKFTMNVNDRRTFINIQYIFEININLDNTFININCMF